MRRGTEKVPPKSLYNHSPSQHSGDSLLISVLVTGGESLLFPTTFIYHFTPVSMETHHDITAEIGRSQGLQKLLGAVGTEQNKC